MIDWAFIGTLEGFELQGYVPDPETSNSGVTIATGIDLGQMTVAQLAPLPQDLQDLLTPYLGLHKAAAVAALKATPLTITVAQANQLNAVGQAGAVDFIRGIYDRSTDSGQFDALPDRAQTVIASVSFQYGDLSKRCPHFWATCVAKNWAVSVHELRNFGDAYPTRRNREAAYLAMLLSESGE